MHKQAAVWNLLTIALKFICWCLLCLVIGAGLLFDCVFMNLTQCHVDADCLQMNADYLQMPCCCFMNMMMMNMPAAALHPLYFLPEIHASCVSYVWFRAALDITWTLSVPCWLPLPFEFLVEDVYWWWTCIDYMIPCCGVICCCSCCSKLVLWCVNPAAVLKPPWTLP